MDHSFLIACHECDLLHRIGSVPLGQVAKCSRCGSVLHRKKRDTLERALALTVAAAILFIIANIYPFLGFKLEANIRQTTLATGVHELFLQGDWPLAGVVLLTTILIPAMQLLGLLYILIPLRMNRIPWRLRDVARYIHTIVPWAMMEVFTLGILVSFVKLAKMATIVPGIALYAFVALIITLTAAMTVLDPHIVWERVKNK
jgi:paraquat-inducible protein A